MLKTQQKTQHQLKKLLKSGEFCSGEDLAEGLGITRSAVWKHIKNIEEQGIPIEAVTGKGYRIPGGLEFLSKSKITSHLEAKNNLIPTKLQVLDIIPSTNTLLMDQMAQKKLETGHIVLAEMQTQGKGRMGKIWHSPYGRNLYLSLLWKFHLDLASLAGLSVLVGLSIIQALASLDISSVKLKWPNDLYADSKKLGGILIESSREAEGPIQAVIGIGLNVHSVNKELGLQTRATCLSELAPMEVYRNQLAAEVIYTLIKNLKLFETQGLKPWKNALVQYDMLKGKQITLQLPNEKLTGVAKGINQQGGIQLKTTQGLQTFQLGSVSNF